MNKFINRLPLDIVLQIIPYTYHLQNKNLLHDIMFPFFLKAEYI